MIWKGLNAALFTLGVCAALALTTIQAAYAQKPAKIEAKPRVSMIVEKRGTVVIELAPKEAPKTVAHFLELVNKKFYDRILFHRVIQREQNGSKQWFVAQAGDPASKKVDGALIAKLTDEEVGQKFHLGEGGSGKTVPLEAKLPHEKGTIAMARSLELDSGDSQFFINLNPNHQLDDQYTVFGRVVKGMDVVAKIRQGDRIVSIRLIESKK